MVATLLATVFGAAAASAQQVPVTVRVGEEAPAAPGDPAAPAPPAAPADPQPAAPDPRPRPGAPAPDPAAPDAPAAPTAPQPAPEPPSAAPPPAPASPLPRTGADLFRLLRDAAAAVAAGVLLVLAVRPSAPKDPA